MKRFKTVLAALMVTSLAFGTVTLTGCQEQGPAESAGEAIDEAAEDAANAAEEAGEEIEDAVQ